MPSLISFFEKLFTNEAVEYEDDVYPNQWIGPSEPLLAISHSHVITIMEFMQHDPFLHTWAQPSGQPLAPPLAQPLAQHSVLDDPRFQLNSIVWTL